MTELEATQQELVRLTGQVEELTKALAEARKAGPTRERLPDEREGVNHHFVIHTSDVEYDGYLTVGCYPDGRVGEVFLKLDNQGSMASGFCAVFSIAFSMLLQLGVPLDRLCAKFRGTHFEPFGQTRTPGIRKVRSAVDYMCRYLERRYVLRLPLADEAPSETP